MPRMPLKYWPKASKDPQREARVGGAFPQLSPTLPTLRLPNDRLELALGDFGLGLSQAADAEKEGPVCKSDRTPHARGGKKEGKEK